MTGDLGIKTKSLLATARVANVSSVVSNVVAGAVVAGVFGRDGNNLEVVWPGGWVWWLVAAGVCLYVAGNFLNDWYDRDWDSVHRPERALPSGVFRPCVYLKVAVAMVAVALVCAWLVNGVALAVAAAIAVFVVIYTVVHKKTAWGVVWVGLCRALLVVLGATGVVWQDAADGWRSPLVVAGLASLPLFFHITGLSVSARFEAKERVPGWAAGVSMGMSALPLLLVWGGLALVTEADGMMMAGALPFALWMVVCLSRRRDIPRYVGGMLAGIPLVDHMVVAACVAAMASGRWVMSPSLIFFPLLAFAAGLVLQRVAPAS